MPQYQPPSNRGNLELGSHENTMADSAEDIENQRIRKRRPNWNEAEKNLLRECLKGELEFIENKSLSTEGLIMKDQAWQKVAHRFNQLNSVERHVTDIRGQWKRLKQQRNQDLPDGNLHFMCNSSDPLDNYDDNATVKNETDSDDVTSNDTVTHEQRNGRNMYLTLSENDGENSPTKYSKSKRKRDSSIQQNKEKDKRQLLQEEHNLRMKQMKEAHSWAREVHDLQKEKLELEILLIKQQLCLKKTTNDRVA